MTSKIKRVKTIEIPVKIKNHKTFVNFDKLVAKTLQKDLKFSKSEDIEKLENSIIKYGFNTIIYLWAEPKTKKLHVTDGNHRVIALNNLITKKDYSIKKVPVIFQEAKNLKEAKELILSNSVKVASISKIAMASWLDDSEFQIDEITDLNDTFTDTNIDFDDVVKMSQENSEAMVAGSSLEVENDDETETKPTSFYIVIDFDTKKARDKELAKIDTKLNASACTDLDIKFK